MVAGKSWSYKDLLITEGLKPESKHFQYFFMVSERGQRKCNYCVWIDNEALASFAPYKDFEEITSVHRAKWGNWVQAKVDKGDFRNLVLKFSKEGKKEIDLNEMEQDLKPE
jgi:hypothetical protein